MEIEKVIEKLLNRDSILNLLENDIIKKFEVSVSPYESKILVIKIFLNITKDELVGTEKLTPKLSEYELRDYIKIIIWTQRGGKHQSFQTKF